MTKSTLTYITTTVIFILVIQSCVTNYFRYNYTDANSLLHEANNIRTKPYLKAHLKNGDVCILKDTWKIDTLTNVLTSYGSKYNFNRIKISEGAISISLDSIAIFETNSKPKNPNAKSIITLSLLAGMDLVLGLVCLANPKACFGSCPTFYINENDNFHYADAEGFSNAISPSMEYFDIDALNGKIGISNTFSITMKNEALETHCVNDVKLLAYPRKRGERVYQSPSNEFYLCENDFPLSQALAHEGNITDLLKFPDRQERFSLSDENNLSCKEEIILNFDKVENTNDLGLILNFRQTLLTTYLFYSSMGYMGDKVSDMFALLESDEKMRKKFDATSKELGDIECYAWSHKTKTWKLQPRINETGPIAINRQFIPLDQLAFNSRIRLKLVLNKGLWRLDYVALTNIKEKVKPIEIAPTSILNKGKLDLTALAEIVNPDKYLISMPGSEYKFNFILPSDNTDYELFLYSKGYYLEWMREHWIKDKDLLKLKQMVDNPKKYLKREAKNYKSYELKMEEEFWNSKIDTKLFSYYEN
ncbi:MAG: hypothetical protein IT267_02520 [Saprospiraceae bacterium]|nr:hypothetical protein [Saprospiraceae bacterium]